MAPFASLVREIVDFVFEIRQRGGVALGELADLAEAGFDLDLTGFSAAEIERLLDAVESTSDTAGDPASEDGDDDDVDHDHDHLHPSKGSWIPTTTS
mgnify:CR=1 FL=1